ncbi:mycothione reductase [Hoyosella rhizosphaerae]|uniref:Mycothione reductase n=1 Tax=Hoyosella rhizosphaerae TaxID=1755582 RepID=A0A916U4S1_9ACTN|nr:mycothione reductase [Hoyosella rhizosphaerae]MBN4926276.1 mycothione reductase [Hoyosella rhizosphaerae]GGC60664.1 mycothione reductase [Hoyosella rhizosphaerae]
MEQFDIAIIGAGSGNMIINRKFADKKVAIIEADKFGGTCLNVGCIPTKMFVGSADAAQHVLGAERFNLSAQLNGVDWRGIVSRIFGRIDGNVAAAEQFRRDNDNVTVFKSHAHFVSDHVLELIDAGDEANSPAAVAEQRISADQIVIAAGGHAHIPDHLSQLPAVMDGSVVLHTSDDIMRIEQLPQRMVIIGSGFISAEFAHVFSSLGVEVTVVARADALLRRHDVAVSQQFTQCAVEQWDVRLNTTVIDIVATSDGARVVLSDGSAVECDSILVAAGRNPNTPGLGLHNTSIEIDEGGRVIVDEYQRTSAQGVWALGDISSHWQLKHVANHEARVVQHNLLNPQNLKAARHDAIPSGVFTSPQIATVGLTSAQAQELGLDVVESTVDYKEVAYGWALADPVGFCKVIVERSSGLIVGAHIVGAQATTLLQPIVQAMSFAVPAADLARGQYWIHPALTEVVENALLRVRL